MQIILLQDIEKVGEKYDVVEVKPGYGRNYLIPQKMAMVANKPNMAKLDAIKAKAAAALEQKLDEFRAIATKIEGKVLKIGAKAGTSGKIFGSITNIQLAQALQEQLGIDVDRRSIIIPEEVKDLGTYTATLNMHKEVQAPLAFEVIAE